MKNIFFTIIILITLSCKAQIVPLEANYWEVPNGSYFKDTFNEMDKFVGTWKFETSTDTLIIIIQKKTYVYDGDEFYEDLLIGEYHYVSNGVEQVNTLPLLNDATIIGRYHNISGKHIIPNQNLYVKCINCDVSERRFILNFHDSDRNYLSVSIVLRYLLNQTNPEKMTATIVANGGVMIPNENSPTAPRVPYGEYTMIKQ